MSEFQWYYDFLATENVNSSESQQELEQIPALNHQRQGHAHVNQQGQGVSPIDQTPQREHQPCERTEEELGEGPSRAKRIRSNDDINQNTSNLPESEEDDPEVENIDDEGFAPASPQSDNGQHIEYVEGAECSSSRTRRTYSEKIEVRLQFPNQPDRVEELLTGTIDRLIKRIVRRGKRHLQTEEEPKHIGFEFMNEHMHSPFYAPARPPTQNNADVLAASVMALDAQYKELKLFEEVITCKIYAVWAQQGNLTFNTNIPKLSVIFRYEYSDTRWKLLC